MIGSIRDGLVPPPPLRQRRERRSSMTKNFRFFGGVSRRTGRAWGGRMRWERADAPRRGRRGYFARRAAEGPTSGPSGCRWENGRGRRPRRPAPGAGRGGASNNRAAGGRGVPTGARDARPYQCRGPHTSGPTNVGPVRTSRAGGGAGTSRAGPLWGQRRGPCGRLAPRVARIHRTPGERSCTGVIETRNRSAWATLRFGANKFNHLSICAQEGPLTDFLSFFYPRKSSCRNANSPRRADISRGDAEARRI